jgi:hypothetical protein
MTTTMSQLDPGELTVLTAVDQLNREKRTTNNSQVASCAHVSRSYAARATRRLSGRRLITNTATGAAYHWRMTAAGRELLAGGHADEPGDVIPEILTAYFERKRFPGDPKQVPVITEVWGNGVPWEKVTPATATYANIRVLRRRGARSLGIQAYGSVPADFTVDELLRTADQPLLGGAVIGSRTWKAR